MLSNKSGFSLLELVVAITIMGISFTVLTSGFGVNIRSLSVTDGYHTADFLMRKLYTETVNSKDLNETSDEGDFGDGYPEFRYKKEMKREGEELFYRVHLAVSFTRLGGERVVESSLILLIPQQNSSDSD